MTEIVCCNENRPVFLNATLNKATEKIFKLGAAVRKCAYETASIMAYVDSEKSYEEDGFKSVHEWAMKTFGFKKSASYSLLRIGKEYTQRLIDEAGKTKGFRSNLLPEEDERDFTVSQIEKMLPLKREDVDELVGANVISPDMTCKEISDVVKVRRHDYVDEEGSSDGETETVAESTACFNGSESEEIHLSFVVDRELGKAVFVDSNGGSIRFELVHLDKFIELIRQTGEIIH